MGEKKKEEEEPMKEIKKRWEKFERDDMEDKAGVLHGVKGQSTVSNVKERLSR